MTDSPSTSSGLDGGDAILEALRNLDVDYIISSPGSEWPSVWEALARQKVNEQPGPAYINCWHETLAVAMASGYTRMTGRMQAVLLHAGVGVLQGSMGSTGPTRARCRCWSAPVSRPHTARCRKWTPGHSGCAT